MKVLLICDYYNDTQLYQEPILSKYYRHLGHEVFVITSQYEDVFEYVGEKKIQNTESVYTIGKNGEKIFRLPYTINILNKIKRFPSIDSILEDTKPDLIYFHDISFNLHEAVKYKKKNSNCKMIMDYHADYSNSGKNWISINILHKIIRKRYLHLYLKYIDKIFPIVPHGIPFLKEIYNIKESHMEVLPLGVDTLAMDEIKGDLNDFEQKIKKQYDIPENAVLIANGGKLNNLKRTEVIINALKQLPDNVHLLLFGKATTEEYQKYLEKLAEGLNVHFLGWISTEDTLKLLSISHMAVFPASQSVLWQQSIGAGLPLIVGDSGGQSAEYLNKNNNVIVISNDNINASYFSNIILSLINDKEKYDLMKEGAAKTTREYLDYTLLAKKTMDV
jgi:glycosyltransferase involved in cell wall biosynthesis